MMDSTGEAKKMAGNFTSGIAAILGYYPVVFFVLADTSKKCFPKLQGEHDSQPVVVANNQPSAT